MATYKSLSKAKISYLEQELFAYSRMYELVEKIRQDITNPYKDFEQSQEVRSSGNSSVVENTVIRLINDKRLMRLQEIKEAVDYVYDNSNYVTREFMELYYFTAPRKYNVQGVSHNMNISEATAYRIRRDVIGRFANELGIY